MVNFMAFVSLIIPTYNRFELPCKTISHVLDQGYPDYEVLVVDQSDRTAPCMKELLSHDSRIKYFKIEEKGLPNARNYGVSKARGEIILFCDDDVMLSRGFVSHHARNYEDESVAGVAGRVLSQGPSSSVKRYEDNPRRIAKIRWFDLYQYDNFDSNVRTPADHAQGCNMSFRREIILRLGGFDKRFGGTAHLEETDFCIRLRNAGYGMAFDPEAELIHLKDTSGGCRASDWQNWFYWYGHNYALLYSKNTKIFFVRMTLKALHIFISAVKKRDISLFFKGIKGMRGGVRAERACGSVLANKGK